MRSISVTCLSNSVVCALGFYEYEVLVDGPATLGDEGDGTSSELRSVSLLMRAPFPLKPKRQGDTETREVFWCVCARRWDGARRNSGAVPCRLDDVHVQPRCALSTVSATTSLGRLGGLLVSIGFPCLPLLSDGADLWMLLGLWPCARKMRLLGTPGSSATGAFWLSDLFA
ncbi:uncharacterized protein [Triticum aestivum]|uniref:uncharacterized protein isoform X2 n=1 Tax=Triticum aestivum TaxID=4565 RepID=UPI001D034B42|nr:uncharacterized protein LOC123071063 isoform X2 [Triticum aestivum]